MAGRRRRVAGALFAALGLVVAFVGILATPAPAGAEETQTVNICNNQKGDDKDCVDENLHGTASWAFAENGDLVFTIEGAEEFDGWDQIYICIPGTEKTGSADCQGNSESVLNPAAGAYSVSGVADPVVGSKDVAFDCDTDFTATVAAATIANMADPITWTIHVNTCDGGTDEAFGSSTRPTTSQPVYTYTCSDATNVTNTSATLNGATTNPDADGAAFTLTGPSGAASHAGTAGTGGAFSADVTGLVKNTAYSYTVTFNDDTTGLGTSATCEFATTDVPAVAPTVETPTSAAVLGVQLTAPAAAPAAAAVAPAQLAATGSSNASMMLLAVGLALVVFGGSLTLASRRVRFAPAVNHSLDA